MSRPDDLYWLGTHVRFTQGDLAAWEKIAAYFLPWLRRTLSYRQLGMDEHLAAESAENALLVYRKDPQRFDATCGAPLASWLLIQARGHLSNLLRRERRHKAKEWAVGAMDEKFEKFLSEKRVEMTIHIRRDEDETQEWQRILDRLLRRLSLRDRMGVELLSRGGSFEEWIEYMGIAGLPTNEQRQRVNMEKTRLTKKLRRLAARCCNCDRVGLQ